MEKAKEKPLHITLPRNPNKDLNKVIHAPSDRAILKPAVAQTNNTLLTVAVVNKITDVAVDNRTMDNKTMDNRIMDNRIMDNKIMGITMLKTADRSTMGKALVAVVDMAKCNWTSSF